MEHNDSPMTGSATIGIDADTVTIDPANDMHVNGPERQAPQGEYIGDFFQDTSDVIEYRHPSWPSDSVWVFRKYRTQADIEFAAQRLAETELDWDEEEERRIRRSGGKYRGKATQKVKMSARVALITSMSVEWRGTAMRLPATYKDRRGMPHPLAGKVPPCKYEYIIERRPTELQDINDFLDDHYKRMEELGDAGDSFQGSGEGASR